MKIVDKKFGILQIKLYLCKVINNKKKYRAMTKFTPIYATAIPTVPETLAKFGAFVVNGRIAITLGWLRTIDGYDNLEVSSELQTELDKLGLEWEYADKFLYLRNEMEMVNKDEFHRHLDNVLQPYLPYARPNLVANLN